MSERSGLFQKGWRTSAAFLTTLTGLATILLTILFFVSVYCLGQGHPSFNSTSRLYSGDCGQASRTSVLLHLAVNIVASIVLASSNFFMQVLIAPTRQEVDKAHARGRWLEIGVQSVKNLRFVRKLNVVFWLLLAVTTLPLHLIFNSCFIETKGSTNFEFIISTESFAHESYSDNSLLQIGSAYPSKFSYNDTLLLQNISASLRTSSWEKLSLEDCYQRYSDRNSILTTHRHAVLVASNRNESLEQTSGWTAAEVYRNLSEVAPDLRNTISPLWIINEFQRTDSALLEYLTWNEAVDGYYGDSLQGLVKMNLSTGLFMTDRNDTYSYWFKDSYLSLQGHYCLSEPVTIPCRIDIDNQLLGIVCLICLIKSGICAFLLVSFRNRNPLITPGDAIESFINHPDDKTIGLCDWSRQDFVTTKSHRIPWQSISRAWKAPSRRAYAAVPTYIWIGSYLVILVGIGAGAFFYHQASMSNPLSNSHFGQDSQNLNVYLDEFLHDLENNVAILTILANTPQVVLSVCYLAYNGLFTRICSEYEWAAFSVKYKPLRVSQKKGQQLSSYRLQLPYHWSIPLLIASVALHWLFSNSIYVIIYESFEATLPYNSSIYRGLQFSTMAILISLITCICLALIPIICAMMKLPGDMVLAGNCSAVIAAACHCVPLRESGVIRQSLDEVSDPKAQEAISCIGHDSLKSLSLGKLKWGVVSTRKQGTYQRTEGDPGHLAFGSEEQNVAEVVEGEVYNSLEGARADEV